MLCLQLWLCVLLMMCGRSRRQACLGARRDGHGRRGAGLDAGQALHLDVGARGAVVLALAARVAPHAVLLVLLAAAAVGRRGRRGRHAVLPIGCGRLVGRLGLGRRRPPVDLPVHPREGLELEAALGPLAAGLAAAVEGAQAGVDSALVRLGAQSVGGGSGLEGAVVAGRENVSSNFACESLV